MFIGKPEIMAWSVCRAEHEPVGHRRHRRRLGGLTRPEDSLESGNVGFRGSSACRGTWRGPFAELDANQLVTGVTGVTGVVLVA